MKIFEYARGLLSFRDLCASRPVCKSWADLQSLPSHAYPVYFFEDGSEFDLPDSDDPNFRICILATKIDIFHCQIFTQDQLDFVKKKFPSIKELTLEIHGNEDPDEILFDWDPDTLSIAVNIQKMIVFCNDFNKEIKIDFNLLTLLTHFETNTRIRFENYDQRAMELFGFVTDHFNQTYNEISKHTNTMQLMRDQAPSPLLLNEFTAWIKNERKYPEVVIGTVNSMRFLKLSRDGLMIYPIAGAAEMEHSDFLDNYTFTISILFNAWPGVPLKFHEDCPLQMRQIWLNLINLVREDLNLSPYTLSS